MNDQVPPEGQLPAIEALPPLTPNGDAEPPEAEELGRIKRAQAAAEKARQRADALMEQAEASRGRFRVLDLAFKTHDRDRRLAGSLLAGALAFRFFLVLLPTILAAVGGLGLSTDAADVEDKARAVGLTAFVADMISSSAAESSKNNIIFLVIGLIGMFFGSRALLKALNIVHALAWRLPQPRGVATLRATAWTMLAIVVVWVTTIALGLLKGEVVGLLAGVVVSLAINGLVILGIQWVMPRGEGTGLRDLWPGAAIAAVGLLATHLATQFYLVGKAASYSDMYGGLGVAAVLLLWLYMLGRLLVAAAMINATRHRGSEDQTGQEPSAVAPA